MTGEIGGRKSRNFGKRFLEGANAAGRLWRNSLKTVVKLLSIVSALVELVIRHLLSFTEENDKAHALSEDTRIYKEDWPFHAFSKYWIESWASNALGHTEYSC